ncbi:MAG: tRNA (guanosine(46)-N7)-methyltransferase TrmB [Pseudomonadota bacterium]
MRLALPALGTRIDPATLHGPGDGRLWLEIGFGSGEHLAAQAAAHPDVLHLGVEPYVNGVAALLTEIDRQELQNVRVVVDDARLLLRALPDACLDRVAVLFPDPWPKTRHHKRRIVDAWSLGEVARLLRVGGTLRLATDHDGYVGWMLEAAATESRLRWTAERPDDWRVRPADWPPTRYEVKAVVAGRRPTFLAFERVAETAGACHRAS